MNIWRGTDHVQEMPQIIIGQAKLGTVISHIFSISVTAVTCIWANFFAQFCSEYIIVEVIVCTCTSYFFNVCGCGSQNKKNLHLSLPWEFLGLWTNLQIQLSKLSSLPVCNRDRRKYGKLNYLIDFVEAKLWIWKIRYNSLIVVCR